MSIQGQPTICRWEQSQFSKRLLDLKQWETEQHHVLMLPKVIKIGSNV